MIRNTNCTGGRKSDTLHESKNSKIAWRSRENLQMKMWSKNAQNKFVVRNTEGDGEARVWSYFSSNCSTSELAKKW